MEAKKKTETLKTKQAAKKSTQAEVMMFDENGLLNTPTGELKAAPGSRSSRAKLRKIATKLIESARTHESAMLKVDWTKEMTDAVEQSLVNDDNASASDEAEASKASTEAYWAEVDRGLAFRKRLVAKLRRAALKNPSVLVSSPILLGNVANAPALVKWFTDVRGVMQRLKPELEKVSSIDWFAQLEKQDARLNKALGLHEQRASQHAAIAEKKRAARNQLALGIQSLYVHAADAFVDDPSVLKQFQKRSALQRKPKAKAKETEPSKAPPGNTGGGGGAVATPAIPAPAQPAVADKPKALLN